MFLTDGYVHVWTFAGAISSPTFVWRRQTCRNKALRSPLALLPGSLFRRHNRGGPTWPPGCLSPLTWSRSSLFPPPLSYYRWPRQGPTWLSMRQMVAPGIEAGIRITIACVRCRISLLSPFNSLGGSERIRPRTLVLLCFSVLWHLLSFLFIDLF